MTGHRITGDRSQRRRGVGRLAVDDHSRVAYVELVPDERGATTSALLGRAVRWFRARGVRIRRVLSDNGSGYVSLSFRRTCQQLRIRHHRTRFGIGSWSGSCLSMADYVTVMGPRTGVIAAGGG